MAKLIQYKQAQGDDYFVVITGNVVEKREGTGTATGRVVNLTLEGTEWDNNEKKEVTKKIDVAFWNSDKEGGAQLCDRIIKAKVDVGSFIAIRGFMGADEKVRAFDFGYQAKWTIKRELENKKDLTFFMGTAIPSKFNTEGRYSISIPTEEWNSEIGDRVTVWNNITFWDNEDRNRAENAQKVLSPYANGKYKQAVVIASEAKPYIDKNGEERVSYNGYNFDVINRKDSITHETVAEAVASVEDISESEDFFDIPDLSFDPEEIFS